MPEAQEVEPQTALITLEDIDAPMLFGEGKLDIVLEYIREQVGDVVSDVSTAKGRTEIKSNAYKIARSKTILDDAGKAYAAELKAKVKGIDGNRRTLRESLDQMRDEIRKPVDDWEAKEKERTDEISSNINQLVFAGQSEGTSHALGKILATVKDTEITEADFGDRQGDAAIQKDIAVSNLERAIEVAKKTEDDAKELTRLRQQTAEQEAQQRLRDAEDAARKEAEEVAQARVDQAEKEASDALEAAERAKEEAAEAIETARKETEAKELRIKEEADARAADVEHRRKVNKAAVDALVEWGSMFEGQARDVVTLIAAGRIPNVTINY